jgi:hypothetical protein
MNPKPLSKTKEETLRAVAKGTVEAELTPRLAREILAALEHERQRADAAGKRAVNAESELSRYKPYHWHD